MDFTLGRTMFLDLKALTTYIPIILSGLSNTFILAFGGFTIGLSLGSILAFAQTLLPRPINSIASAVEEILRSIPLLVLMLIIFFGLPEIGVQLDPLTSAILAIGLRSLAYQSQIIRGAILAIPREQIEAALALGMTRLQSFIYIVLPQAYRIALPALVNQLTIDIKDTCLAYAIGVSEMFTQSIHVAQVILDYLTPLLFVGIVYFIITISLSYVSSYLYTKYRMPGLGEDHG